jgi:hypothetical protein
MGDGSRAFVRPQACPLGADLMMLACLSFTLARAQAVPLVA